jgi:hypothetical protein
MLGAAPAAPQQIATYVVSRAEVLLSAPSNREMARTVVTGADHFRCNAQLRPEPVGKDEAVTLGVFHLPFDPQARPILSPSRGKDHGNSHRAAELDPVIGQDNISIRADQGLPFAPECNLCGGIPAVVGDRPLIRPYLVNEPWTLIEQRLVRRVVTRRKPSKR